VSNSSIKKAAKMCSHKNIIHRCTCWRHDDHSEIKSCKISSHTQIPFTDFSERFSQQQQQQNKIEEKIIFRKLFFALAFSTPGQICQTAYVKKEEKMIFHDAARVC
jgi:hypothetical protein